MSIKLRLAAAAAVSCIALSGCTLPGEKARDEQEDDYFDNTVATTTAPVQEEVINYRWALKPSVDCDNIITPDCSLFDENNIKSKAYLYTSIIIDDGKLGFIDLNGNMVVYPEYDNYYIMPTGEVYLASPTGDGGMKVCWLDDYLRRQEGTFVPEVTAEREYYWSESDSRVYCTDGNGGVIPYEKEDTVAVCRAEVTESFGSYSVSNIDTGAYALADVNGLLTDFEFEDHYCPLNGDPADTLIALKKNGKWGYSDDSGNIVLDFNFYDMPSAYSNNAPNSDERSHPYLYSEGFVAVQNEKGGGYYTKDGSLLIPMGSFRQARPIQSGRAWVNVDGLWGVITLGEVSDFEMPKITTTTTTTTTAAQTQSWSWTTTTEAQTAATTQATVAATAAPATTAAPVTTAAPQTTAAPVQTTEAPAPAPAETPQQADPEPEPVVTNGPSVGEDTQILTPEDGGGEN